MKPLRVLITGGSGFIGTHLCRVASARRWEVSVLDLKIPEHPVPGVHYHRGSVLEDDLLLHLVEKVDQVVHLAAIVSVPLCELDPVGSYETNFLGTVKVSEAIARVNRTARASSAQIGLHFASSAAVYGDEGDRVSLLQEDDVPIAPLSNYGLQKRASELFLELQGSRVPSWSFRFFNVYGPGQDPNSPYSGVISIFMEKLRKGEPLTLFGDGEQTRDFISVHDVVHALVRAIELPSVRKLGQAINIATGKSVSVRELGELLALEIDRSLHWNAQAPRSGDIRSSCGNPARARALLSWVAETELSAGLRTWIRGVDG
jgi:UDP-glucose 4-epimerase